MNPTNTNGIMEILKQNQRLILIAVPLALTLFIVIIAIIFLQPTPTQPANITTNQQSSSPTPNQVMQAEKLQVASVTPLNNSANIGIFTPITVSFSRAIPQSDQPSYVVSTTPPSKGTLIWSSDNTKLTYTPTDLSTETAYEANVTAKGESFTWKFQTVLNENVSEEDIIRIEKESAEFTKQQDAEFQRKYPWWDEFPIESERYFAYYDTDKKKFVGLLYPSRSANTSLDAQTEAMKNEITTTIRGKGINVNQYGGIEWQVTPEP